MYIFKIEYVKQNSAARSDDKNPRLKRKEIHEVEYLLLQNAADFSRDDTGGLVGQHRRIGNPEMPDGFPQKPIRSHECVLLPCEHPR